MEPQPLSPRTKRQQIWELEDSQSDSQASSMLAAPNKADKESEKELKVMDSDKADSDSDDLETTLLCLICNESFDSPESSHNHMLCTGHESYEMIRLDVYEEEMKESLFALEREPEKDDWEVLLRREFKIIFQLELETDVALFTKCYDIFREKIKQSMVKDSISLFSNVPLKAQIFEFIQAQNKIYNCNFCHCVAFNNLDDLKKHVEENEAKGCKFTDAQRYVYRI